MNIQLCASESSQDIQCKMMHRCDSLFFGTFSTLMGWLCFHPSVGSLNAILRTNPNNTTSSQSEIQAPSCFLCMKRLDWLTGSCLLFRSLHWHWALSCNSVHLPQTELTQGQSTWDRIRNAARTESLHSSRLSPSVVFETYHFQTEKSACSFHLPILFLTWLLYCPHVSFWSALGSCCPIFVDTFYTS